MSRMILEQLVAGFLITLASCAKVGVPLPPLPTAPTPARDLRLVQDVGEGVYLLFTLPDDAEKVEVLRSCETQAQSSEPDLVASFRRADLEPFHFGLTRARDPDPRPGSVCRYQVRFVGEDGRRSDLSNMAHTQPMPVANPPTRLQTEVHEDHIRLRWDPPRANLGGTSPANVVGYLVNSEHFVTDPYFVDEEFEFGQTRTYRVQSVSKQSDPTILSDFSEPLTLVPRDTFPPQAPTHLDAVRVAAAVQLIWDPVEAEDLEGYYVYRRGSEGEFERVAPLVEVSRYLDQSLPGDVTLSYRVTAVDQWGNESQSSETVTVRIGGPSSEN